MIGNEINGVKSGDFDIVKIMSGGCYCGHVRR